jgi:hypothetical protein
MSGRTSSEAEATSREDLEKGSDSKDQDRVTADTLPATDNGTSKEKKESDNSKTGASQPNLTDWNGPDDPDNPHTWGKGRKLYHIVVPGLFGFAV